jgi:hypothetical protein
MTTPCTHFRDDLKAYADGELRGLLRLRVKRHVSHCAACREEIEAMELIRRRMRQNDPSTFTPELKDKILAGLPDGTPPVPEAADATRKPKKPLLIFGATAAAVVSWFLFYPVINRSFAPQYESAGSSAEMSRSVATGGTAANAPMAAQAETKSFPKMGISSSERNDSGLDITTESDAVSAGAAMKSGRSGEINGRELAQVPAASASEPPASYMSVEKAPSEGAGGGRARRAAVKLVMPSGANQSVVSALDTERQVHREATLEVQVDSAEAKSNTVETMTKTEGGYVADSSLNTLDDGTKSATLTLKVPVDRFEAFLTGLGKLGEVKSKNVSGEDLTERISDEKQSKRVLGEEIEETQARLKQRRQSKLQEREDREALRELKTRIAIKQARLEMYKKMATLSTISLTLSEKPKNPPQAAVQPPSGFFHDLKGVASEAGQTFMQAAKLPFILLIWIAVYAPVWLILLAGYRYFVRA